MTYKSFDGKEFKTDKERSKHEKEVLIEEYNKKFVKGTLKKRAKYVIDTFLSVKGLPDNKIERKGEEPRYEVTMCGEYSYGINYLRDDAVEILINRIKELEGKKK